MSVPESRPSQKVRRVRFSLRLKLLLALTMTPIIALALYLRIATNIFANDKQAYVTETGVALSRSIGAQVKLELESLIRLLKPILEGFDTEGRQFSSASQDLFRSVAQISELYVCAPMAGGGYEQVSVMRGSDRRTGGEPQSGGLDIPELCHRSAQDTIWLGTNSQADGEIILGLRLGDRSDPRHLVALAMARSSVMLKTFSQPSSYANFLLNSRGEAILSPEAKATSLRLPASERNLFADVARQPTPEGVYLQNLNDGREVMVAYSRTGVGGFTVVSALDRKVALQAVDAMIYKSVLFFVVLIASTLLLSVIASVKLTGTLSDLYLATKRIAEGRFDFRITARSNDELGGLADSFNVMAGKVSKLLVEATEKARMENELSTVKTVQETLFPPSELSYERMSVVGHFEPASECGGDWWSCGRIGSSVYLWVGDATGHGAPAALITSAARSAAAIIETLPDMTPGRALKIMNRAIHETSKGKINMTFFLAAIDEATGVMTYANASHDPPFLVRRPEEGPVKRSHLLALVDVNGPRLGELPDAEYAEAQVQLMPTDHLVVYTDGVTDVRDPSGKAWGERSFIKAILSAMQAERELRERMGIIRHGLAAHRGASTLIDDVTIVMAQFKDAA